ncbi:MAG TPA: DUF748 domain-containing protein [Rariglobus sp.]|nr:DUF748 domain-containing protein [Rariglobus sp.]
MKNPAHIQDIRADLAHAQKSSHRRRRRWLIVAGVFSVFVLFGFFGLPSIIKAQAIRQLSAQLHREVSIESVQVNPLVLSITIDGLAIKDRDGSPFVGWKRLYVNFDSWSLFTGEWRFQEIDLDGFSGSVALNKDGSFNFSDLIPPPSPAPASAEPAKPGRPLHISKLAVTAAVFSFNDHSRAAPFATRVGPMTFTLAHFRTAGDRKAPYAFTAVTEAGETFNWRGTVTMDPVQSKGDFNIGGITLKKYAPYYSDRVRADVLDGKLDVAAHYAIVLKPDAQVLLLDNATIKITGLKVAERGADTPVVELPSFVIEGLSADGVKQSATIKSITLDHPSLRVRRDKDGSINLLTMLTPGPGAAVAAAQAPSVSATPSAAPLVLPDVKLGEFAIRGLSVALEDLTTPTPAKNSIENIDLSVKNVSLAEGASPIAVKLSAMLPPGGEIGVEGTVTREPLSADVSVKLATIPLSGVTPYVEPFLNLRIAGGNFSVDGKARLAGKAASFQGDINVANFTTVDGVRAEDFVKFTSFNILGLEATTEPLAAKIEEINLVDPAASFTINADKTTNFSNVLRQAAPASGAPAKPAAPVTFPKTAPAIAAAPSAPSPVWSLGKFTLTNGTFTLSDRSVQPAVRTSLDQFSGTVAGLSSADLERADVDFHGKVDGVGSVAITGKLNARAATPDPSAATDLTVDVKGVDLSPLSPYVGTYAGYELARGSLFVDVKTHLAQRKIDSANVVTLNQFTLGPATNNPLATKLPVRLGIALLKDIDGNIVIDLPVKGSLDDPSFKIGKVVLRVIVNLLVKAATSPFSLIGSMFGGGGDELAFQDFAPGAVSPLDTETKKIETLRKALKSRPALNLDITGTYDAEKDTEALRQQQLDKQVRARLWTELRAKDPATPPPDQITVTPEESTRLIGELFAEKFPAGAVVKSDGAVMAVPPPPSPPEYKPRAYHRGQPVLRPSDRTPSHALTMPAGSVVTVAGDMHVQQVAAAPTLAEMRRLLTADIPVSDDDLRQLATARAQHVRAELLAGGEVAETRLFLTPVPAQGKGARVLLQLK